MQKRKLGNSNLEVSILDLSCIKLSYGCHSRRYRVKLR